MGSLPARASLEGRVQELLSAANLGGTEVSILIYDLRDHQTLVALDADELMIPASNMKLVTTAVAADVLGPGFSFFTELRMLPLEGGPPALWVIGNGDPTFGSPDVLAAHGIEVDQLLDKWVSAVRSAHAGDWRGVIVDDRVFDRVFTHPSWPADQLSNHWCAGVGGLNFYGNCIEVIPQPADMAGASPSVRLFPPAGFMETTNRATTGRNDSFWVSRSMTDDQLVFRGTVRHRRSSGVRVAVRDPGLYLGEHVKQAIEATGVAVGPVERADGMFRPEDYTALHRVETALGIVMEQANRDSDNLSSEGLFKAVGWQTTGQPGSWENGAAAVRLALRERLGPRAAAFQIADGSGLSRDNRVTARLLVELLSSVYEDEAVRDLYLESLAVGGESGTLDDRMASLEGARVLAKSGYLNGVSGLSGYLLLPEVRGGERVVVFSLLFNEFRRPVTNSRLKRVQDQILAAVAASYD
ncbi:D-alanyl-D-alanine carboxypeptidase/D-alanyl-D-alanine endopeptidase [Mucisphaera sp.]|uniref:D-alanyl-D-alanine carboxypeptidase/D-alanyl-D-alanine endopeptidase n=1 Tax=Mucisphaera sp. TaxID=2913024 RepID=UPI003D0EEA83